MSQSIIEDVTLRTGISEDALELRSFLSEAFTDKFGYIYKPEDLEYFLKNKYSLQNFKSSLEDKNTRWLFATYRNRIIGVCQLSPCDLPFKNASHSNGELCKLYVHRDYHSQGIGAKLMESGLEWLINFFPNQNIYLGVFSENFGAQKFYARYGFNRVGEYYYPVGNHMDFEFILELTIDTIKERYKHMIKN